MSKVSELKSHDNEKDLITFIGAGNMAGAIIRGLVHRGYPPTRIRAAAPSRKNLDSLQQDLGISVDEDNSSAANGADVVVLGVKPQMMEAVCTSLRPALTNTPLVISLAAGVSCANIAKWLGKGLPIVRSMSNTPAQVGLGASGLYANEETKTQQRALAETIIASVGIVRWVANEDLIDSVTAIAGSGPAYFFLFMEAMIAAGIEQGLDADTAKALALQTARGAAELASQSDEGPGELRARVTSPKGTTEQAIKSFQADGLETIVKNAMQACRRRAQELAGN